MRIDTRTFLASLLLLGTVTTTSRGQHLTLDSVLYLVDSENPMLAGFDNKVKALDAYAEGAGGWMAPMIGVGTFMTPYPGQQLMESRDKGSIMFSLEQEIPNRAKLAAKRKYFASRSAVEEQGRSGELNELRAEAKEIYYKWSIAERRLTILRESEEIINLMLKLAKLRYPYNQGTLGNIYKAEGRLGEIQNMMLMTQGDIEESRYRLKALMNLSPETIISVDTTSLVKHEILLSMQDTASLSTSRSDVGRIDKSIDVMLANQRLQRLQSRPDFKIRFDHMQPIGNMPMQFTAMAMVSIPIAPWSSRMYKSEIRGMEFDIAAMRQERKALLLDAQGMLAGMITKLGLMRQQLENYRLKIIPALNRNYQSVMLSYEENREQLPMVIDGWEALNMAQMEYLNRLEEYYTMIVSYEKELEK